MSRFWLRCVIACTLWAHELCDLVLDIAGFVDWVCTFMMQFLLDTFVICEWPIWKGGHYGIHFPRF